MLRDLHNSTAPVMSVAPADADAETINGSSADLAIYNAADVVFVVGTPEVVLSASIKLDLSLEESDDDSTFTAVDAADQIGDDVTIDADDEAGKAYHIGYIGSKRYVRAKIVATGDHGTAGTPVAAAVIRAFPRIGVGEVS